VQAWAFYTWTSIAQLATALGRDDLAAPLLASSNRLKLSFNDLFFNGTAICDGLCSQTPHTAAHSSFYALAFGLVSDSNVPAVSAYIQGRAVRDEIGPPCGPYAMQFLVQVGSALSEYMLIGATEHV
jgi:hypothetical protein